MAKISVHTKPEKTVDPFEISIGLLVLNRVIMSLIEILFSSASGSSPNFPSFTQPIPIREISATGTTMATVTIAKESCIFPTLLLTPATICRMKAKGIDTNIPNTLGYTVSFARIPVSGDMVCISGFAA